MFCKNCGTEMDETMAFCPECGTKAEVESVCVESEVVADEAVVETTQTETQEENSVEVEQDVCVEEETDTVLLQPAGEVEFNAQEVQQEVQAPAKKGNKLLISIIAGVVMIALVVAGIFVVPKLLGGNLEDIALKYSLAYAEADLVAVSEYTITDFADAYNKMVEYSCEEYEMTEEEFYELLSEQYGEKVDNIDQLFVLMREEAVTYLEEEYGNYTISGKVVGSEEMPAEKLKELTDYIIEDQGYDYPSMFDGIDASKISEAYIVEVELTINGTESSDTETQEVTIVKYNGKWKVISE